MSTRAKNNNAAKAKSNVPVVIEGYQVFTESEAIQQSHDADDDMSLETEGNPGKVEGMVAASQKTEKRKLKVPDMDFRYRAVMEVEKGRMMATVARELGLNRSTLGTWYAKKDYIKECYQKFGPNTSRKAVKPGKWEELEAVLFQWYLDAKEKGARLTGTVVQETAIELAGVLGITDFTGSRSWLERFKNRHSIFFRSAPGSSNSAETIKRDSSTWKRPKNLLVRDMDFRYRAITEVEKGRKQTAVAQELGVSQSTMATWCASKETIKMGYQEYGPKQKSMKAGRWDELEAILLKWYLAAKEQCEIIPRNALLEKADELAESLGIADFKANIGWLTRFRYKNKITFTTAEKKRTLVARDIGFKYRAIVEVEKGRRLTLVACELGISDSTLATWYARKDFIKKGYQGLTPKRSLMRMGKWDELDNVLLKLYLDAKEKGVKISSVAWLKKADQCAKSLGLTEFKATLYWLGNFKKRHGIIFKRKRKGGVPVTVNSSVSGDANDSVKDTSAPAVQQSHASVATVQGENDADCVCDSQEERAQPGMMMIKQEPVDPAEATADGPGQDVSLREQLRLIAENKGKHLTVKSVVEDLLRQNEFILSQNNADQLKPHSRTTRTKPSDSDNNLGTVLQPKDPTEACTKDDVADINGAVVEVAVTDMEAMHDVDLVCAVGSKIMLLKGAGQKQQMDLTCYWCNFCSFKSNKKEVLLQHVMEHRFHCKYCKFQSFSRAAVIQHGCDEHDNFAETASTLKFCTYLPDILQRNEVERKRKGGELDGSGAAKKRKTADEDLALNMEVEEVDEEENGWPDNPPGRGSSPGRIVTPTKMATRKTLPAPLATRNLVKIQPKIAPKPVPVPETPPKPAEEPALMPVITNIISGAEAVSAAGGLTSPQKPVETPKPSEPVDKPAVAVKTTSTATTSSGNSTGGETTSTSVSSGLCWNCGYCGFVTLSQAFLKIHLNANHQGRSHKYVAMLVSSDVEMERIKASDLQLSKNPNEKLGGSSYPVTTPATQVASTAKPDAAKNDDANGTPTVGIEIDNAEMDSEASKDDGEEEKKIPVSFKCAHCNYSAPQSNKVKSHLFQRHSGSVMYALDMKAVKLRQKRYVFFCMRVKCTFETKDVNDFIEHSETCTPWLEGGSESSEADSAMIKSLEMTKQFIIKTQSTVSGQSKEFRFDRITAEYGCDYCSYISNNNTRLKKHVLSIHANKSCVIRDLQAEKNKRKPTVYFCVHCLWETREGPDLELHLKKTHDSDLTTVPPITTANSTSGTQPAPAVAGTSKSSAETNSTPAVKSPVSAARAKPKSSPTKEKESSPSSDASSDKDDDDTDLTDLYADIVPAKDIAKAMKEFVESEQSPRGRGRPARNAAMQARIKNKLTKPPPLYKCVVCTYHAFGVKIMRKHIKDTHKKQALYAIDILKHSKKQTDSEKVFFCPDANCTHLSTLHADVEQHAKTVHHLKATDPDLVLMSRVSVAVSHQIRSPDGTKFSTTGESYECLYCSDSKVFYTRKEMKSHLRSAHSKEPLIFRDCIARKLKQPSRFYLCAYAECEYMSEKERSCALHALAHKKTKIQECSRCQWFTESASMMKGHHKEAHPGESTLTMIVDLDLDSQGQLVKLVNGTAIKADPDA